MIEIKPNFAAFSNCPYCRAFLRSSSTIWLGMRVCARLERCSCGAEIIEDLNISYAIIHPCQIDLVKETIFCDQAWFGQPLLQSLKNPQKTEIDVSKEIFSDHSQVIILNCIDFLWGHSLLKLLVAQKHLDYHSEYGLIVVIQKCLRWMVPDGVAEIWTVDIPLKKGTQYFTAFNQYMRTELGRFDRVFISKASTSPKYLDITKFTRVPKHDFNSKELQITFVWREDRLWMNILVTRILRKTNLEKASLLLQNWRIVSLFKRLRKMFPGAKFAVAGLGTNTKFPHWIQDHRVSTFNAESERKTCEVYSLSRLVIGVHGSNMLLPSAHAGMTIDLMMNGNKINRWGNITQDILYQTNDVILGAFCYQFVSFEVSIAELARIAQNMVSRCLQFQKVVEGGLNLKPSSPKKI